MDGPVPAQRIDKFLWFARLTKTRGEAQSLAKRRRIRIEGRVIRRASACVHVGDVIAFTRGERVRIVRVSALGDRRGPYTDARELYTDLAPGFAVSDRRDHVQDSPG
ncbi:RNA-binding S4 domain-containing protein [Pacificimonas sp. WHA3]|uniref:RNA-binding S4 domain-containing protein n=1 Tax=Pacificimonas pallii TaxID=2827236 RepID=A0ABS6SH95_9SPHN|nr:RNA-binding S4 domain-containing protein [Pacificimonas pallii]